MALNCNEHNNVLSTIIVLETNSMHYLYKFFIGFIIFDKDLIR